MMDAAFAAIAGAVYGNLTAEQAKAYAQQMDACKGLHSSALFNADTVFGHSGLMVQNAYVPPPKFPRSEAELDSIMLRRYGARKAIKHKHWMHVAGIVIAAPVVLSIIVKVWTWAALWIVM